VKDIIEQNTAGIYSMWNWWGTPKNPDAKNKKRHSDLFQPHKSMQAQYTKETVHKLNSDEITILATSARCM